ncbi:hypothetical protein K402DRAFT_418591 [Aulographum hederae CBS 113979]|uniref:Vegetative cell wall protein gp1 n=1 Tax=Aulographum hederae CBS 113979 TaxID=1176131 RepID=A0A6G1H8B5_9PEZI|nr:hypothetical protein K402DRAFT_418591 [Aulographum hederae CBS 113979]
MPPGYGPGFDAPPTAAHYNRYNVPFQTPSPRGSPKVHHRRASQDPAAFYARANPPPPQFTRYNSSPAPGSGYYAHQRPDYVSDHHHGAGGATKQQQQQQQQHHRSWVPADSIPKHSSKKHHTKTKTTYAFWDDGEQAYQYRTPPPPYEPFGQPAYHTHEKVPIYTEAEPTPAAAYRAHTRRASYAGPRASPQKPKTTSTKRPATARRQATDADALRAGIPSGFAFKNWDPDSEPILLLGSVFDANSLGKWIYDWTVFYYGPATPMSDVAGALWLDLIQLAGKVKRADETMTRIRRADSRELVEEFIDSGERLWIRFKKILKVCEDYMWKAAQKESGEKKPAQMGKGSGCEFVRSIFGRDRELEKVEKLMSAITLWSKRFDANCDEILRNPSA